MIIKELKDVVGAFKKLQIKHHAIIDNGVSVVKGKSESIPDLDLMNDERENAFNDLKNLFDRMSELEGTLDELEDVRQDMSEVLEMENKIRDAIEKYRAELRESVDRMSRGKMALKGYGGSGL